MGNISSKEENPQDRNSPNRERNSRHQQPPLRRPDPETHRGRETTTTTVTTLTNNDDTLVLSSSNDTISFKSEGRVRGYTNDRKQDANLAISLTGKERGEEIEIIPIEEAERRLEEEDRRHEEERFERLGLNQTNNRSRPTSLIDSIYKYLTKAHQASRQPLQQPVLDPAASSFPTLAYKEGANNYGAGYLSPISTSQQEPLNPELDVQNSQLATVSYKERKKKDKPKKTRWKKQK